MPRKIASALIAALFLAAVPAVAAEGDGKISGLLKEIRSDGKLLIEEQGPWKGPGTGLTTRIIDLTPDTSIRVVRPTGKWEATDANPGYEIQPADFRALKPGDFVTVTTGGRSMAASIDVMRSDDSTGLASPRMDSLGTK